jgi:putative hydrolase of the HAD superfamily
MARQAITFDFHDTLVHCDEWFELEVRELPAAFAQWHAEHHGPLTADGDSRVFDAAYRELRRSIIEHGHELTAERSLAVVFGQSGVHVEHDILETGVRELMMRALADATAVPGAIQSVRELAGHGIPLGIVSSAVYHPFLEWALARLEILDAFEVVVTSASCGFYKSRPEIYWHTLELLDADAATSLHIGDSLRFDVGGASRAGMRTVWLDHAGTESPELTAALTLSTLEGSTAGIIELLSRQ